MIAWDRVHPPPDRISARYLRQSTRSAQSDSPSCPFPTRPWWVVPRSSPDHGRVSASAWRDPSVVRARSPSLATSENISNFWGWKIPLASPLSPLSTIIRTSWRVGSRPVWLCQWLTWLWSNKHKHSRVVKNSGQHFHPSIRQHQPTIRHATKGVSKPIWGAKCGFSLHLSIALLVVEISARILNIPLVEIAR